MTKTNMAFDAIGTCLSLKDFESYVRLKDFGSLPANKLVIHHTWKPTVSDWNGKKSFDGLVSYYTKLGWTAGPHLFIAPDGIWLMTDMRKNGVHAGSLNWRSIGIEVVGNYDTKVWEEPIKSTALNVIKILMKRLGIANENLRFHRDVSSKTCPGSAITKEWLYQQLALLDNKIEAQSDVSKWAQDGWNWQKELGLDVTVHPHQQVEAEWVFAILKKIHDIEHPL